MKFLDNAEEEISKSNTSQLNDQLSHRSETISQAASASIYDSNKEDLTSVKTKLLEE
jgi:hypothetical protein